uniref:Uncharacterized protein n=1 Tax=Mucochytrium quahogii TaxID=96639 RepID=A0A7S2WA58_9STRA|mmetsp:Transcript_3123/g.5887  ORF Transcript_3123/g.5887 Transcript_3123/m.5887 type:complete len:546 (-) Transcript_3123:677-2314(-)
MASVGASDPPSAGAPGSDGGFSRKRTLGLALGQGMSNLGDGSEHPATGLEWVQEMVDGLRFSVVLAAWSLAVAFVAMGPFMWRRWSPGRRMKDVDLANNATLPNPLMVCKLKDSYLERFWCAEVFNGNVALGLPLLVGYNCIIYLLYVKLRRDLAIVWILISFTGYFVTIGVIQLHDSPSISKLLRLAGISCLAVPVLFLKVSQPKGSRIWVQAVKSIAVAGLCNVVTVFFSQLISARLLFLCMFWPVFREVILFISRNVAYTLATDPYIAGEGVEVRREFAWLFVLLTQVFVSTWYRLVVTELEDIQEFVLFIFVSTTSEIALRLTVVQRDDIFMRAYKSFRRRPYAPNRSKKSSVIVPGSGMRMSSEVAKSMDGLRDLRQGWAAQVCLGEMLAEYIGLLTTTGLVLLHRDAIFTLPLPIFGDNPNLFDQKMKLEPFLVKQAVQFISELLVDTLCVVIEKVKFRCPIERIWTSQSVWSRWVNLFTATCIANGIAVSLMYMGAGMQINLHECLNTDLCTCAPQPTSVTGRYCHRLYPKTNGIPSS